MSSHKTSNKNTYSKRIYFFPTCREAGKVDDPCVTVNLEKSLSSRVDIHILEAFNNFREDFQKSLQKQREVDQTFLLLTKRMHPPRSGQILESSSSIESLEVEFAPELNKFLASTRILVAS